jgi:uncharacterized membrane protein YhaH (DUF805 family)
MEWYLGPLRKYADFSGRASRKEYWPFLLGQSVIGFVLFLLFPVLYFMFLLGTIVPALAVWVRRLHDTNRSGWWLFITFVPVVGSIVMFVFLVLEGTSGDNDYGSNPLLTSAVSSPRVGSSTQAGASEITDQPESPPSPSDSSSYLPAAPPPPTVSRPVIKMKKPGEPRSSG